MPELPLAGRRVLVPPSRPEVNPLLRALQLKGAEVSEWPRLAVAEPVTFAPLDAALREAAAGKFDWLLFAGSPCVRNFFGRLEALGLEAGVVFGARVAAVGHGALSALKERGVAVAVYPARHVADDVARALEAAGPLKGQRFLLVRVAGAPRALPERLAARGAEVSEAAGYRLVIQVDTPPSRPEVVALANPAAVRIFLQGLAQVGVEREKFLAGVLVASVGPATSEAASLAGLEVGLSAGGSQAALLKALLERLGR